MKRNWKKKYLILSLFPLLLSSCQNSSKQCYRCSMGYMLTSTFSLPYSLILNHQIQRESYPEITTESYYSNLYVLTNQEAVDDFYSRYHENISSLQKKSTKIKHFLTEKFISTRFLMFLKAISPTSAITHRITAKEKFSLSRITFIITRITRTYTTFLSTSKRMKASPMMVFSLSFLSFLTHIKRN